MKGLALIALLTVVWSAQAQPASVDLPAVRPGAVPPDFPVKSPDSNFPLRVHLLTVRFGGLGNVYHGYGSGNLVGDRGTLGFDFGFQCNVPFVANQSPDETYQARWTASQYGLEILTTEVGVEQPREHTCTLLVAARKRPFEPADTAALSHGVSSSLRKRWQNPDFAYEETQLDYPVHFHVVDGQRLEDNAADHGWGTANLTEPGAQSVQGAEYTYNCSNGFLTNSQLTGFYQGRWVTPGSALEVLLQRPGSDKIDKCLVEVQLKPQPYPQSRHIAVTVQTSSAALRAAPATP
jgi:hypothetical protein